MSDLLPIMNAQLPANGLDAYITRVYQIPLLTQAEELAYAQALHHENDLDAAKKLVMPHLRYVVKVARSYSGYGIALADLIQEGNVGLMKAVKRFDPEVGVRLVTFAMHWIKAEIHDYILKNWRIVKVATTKAQRKLFFKLRQCKDKLSWLTHDEAKTVANDLGVKVKDVLQMEQRLYSTDMTFEKTSDDEDYAAPEETLADNRFDPAALVSGEADSQRMHLLLREALDALDARAQIIVTERWLTESKATLKDLAARFNVSVERIRQLEASALQSLGKALSANA